MAVAIVCPKHSINPALLAMLAETTSGKVLKIIGSKKENDITGYDEAIIVYQYSLSSINSDFIRFCEKRNNLKKVTLVIDIPVFHIEKNPEWMNNAKELISFFSSQYKEREVRAAVMNVGDLDVLVQRKYADELEARFLAVMNKTELSRCNVAIVFNARSDERKEISETKGSIIAIVLIILMSFSLIIRIIRHLSHALWMGIMCSLVPIFIILRYLGRRGDQFAYWNGDIFFHPPISRKP
ncbi:MAG: hypothetical protein FWG96_03890 [Methanomassiliicoccaceae archaeon]|nr:hypothetical protein [Methanomassiliicoccaceae archaeon]